MSSLKEKAKSKSGNSGSSNTLATKAKSKSSADVVMGPKDQIEPPKAEPNMTMPAFNATPPVPPALAFTRHLATIPGLRKRERGI